MKRMNKLIVYSVKFLVLLYFVGGYYCSKD